MKYNKIVLIGMMGSGKSTVSKLLSEKLNLSLLDTDEIFEQQEKCKIVDFFKKYGEEKFREIESEILKKSLTKSNCIISTGGGIVLKEENRILLSDKSILTIYLSTNYETIYNRIKDDKTRPLLLVKNPKEEIKKILNSREQFYNQAKATIETDNKTQQEIAEEILKIYG